MNRRDAVLALIALGAATRPLRAGAQTQPAGKVYRIGWLGNSTINTPEAIRNRDSFRLALVQSGWTEGRNIAFEYRFAEGVTLRFPQLARELVELKVDLILATSTPAAIAAKKATDTIPVVFVTVPNAVEQDLVASLARPGGNLTGLSNRGYELVGKRLELLKEAFPRIKRIAYLPHLFPVYNEQTSQAAEALGMQLLPASWKQAADFPGAFAGMARADAWFVAERIEYFVNRKTIVDLVAGQRKPAMYPSTFFVEAGGLMSYAAEQNDQFRRAAGYADRILRGAKPADLPVEEPTQFELAINMKTAKDSGIAIAPAFLLRADRVIE